MVNPEGAFVESLELADRTPLIYARRDMPTSGKNRGGIPVCAPIFGPGESVGLNQHGFARNLRWEVIEQADSQVKLTLDNLGSQMQDLPPAYWGCSMELTVELIANDDRVGLRESLLLRNTGTESYIANPAFHPYFPVRQGRSAEKYEVQIDDRAQQFMSSELAATRKIKSVNSFAILRYFTEVWEVHSKGLPFFAVWTDTPDSFICVEPTESGYISDAPADELPPNREKTVQMELLFRRPGV